jgi:ubiquinone/menaquinone biosynthesis C-methylase UbiE
MDIVTGSNDRRNVMKHPRKVYFKMMSFVHETLYGLFRDPYKTLKAAGLEPGQRVLEVGCGPGFFTVSAAKIVGQEGNVLALDVNPIAVEHVNKKIQEAGAENVSVVLSDAGATGLPEQSFDLAFVFGVAHPIGSSMDAIWTETHRLLQPEGTLAVEGRIQPPKNLFRCENRMGRVVRYVRL